MHLHSRRPCAIIGSFIFIKGSDPMANIKITLKKYGKRYGIDALGAMAQAMAGPAIAEA